MLLLLLLLTSPVYYKMVDNNTESQRNDRRIVSCLSQLIYFDSPSIITIFSIIYYRNFEINFIYLLLSFQMRSSCTDWKGRQDTEIALLSTLKHNCTKFEFSRSSNCHQLPIHHNYYPSPFLSFLFQQLIFPLFILSLYAMIFLLYISL